MYPEIRIDDDMRNRAKSKYNKIKLDPSRDRRRFGSEGRRLLYGYLGEVIVMDYYEIEDVDDYEYDAMWGDYKMDVKSISCKFKPPMHYLATVNSCEIDGDHRQDADVYFFVRIREDCQVAWLVGLIECERFFEMSKFLEKGETYHGMTFEKANTNVLPIRDLHRIL